MAKLNLSPLGGIKRRLNGLNDKLQNGFFKTQRAIAASFAVDNCVENKEHKVLLYAMLQLGLDVIIDSRESCVQNTNKYLNAVRPAKLDNLVRIGGQMDGGYVMLPPPPPLSLALNQKHSL